jgi:chromate transporter
MAIAYDFFAYSSGWPFVDRASALIAVAVAVACFLYQRNVIRVIAACAVAGLMVKMLI